MPTAELLKLLLGGAGPLTLVALALYELYAPKYLGKETALHPIVEEVPDKVDDLSEDQDEIKGELASVKGDVSELHHHQEMSMQVLRAQARANEQMDHERVDQYLLENGVEPDEFLKGDEMDGYSNWRDEEKVNDGE